jgi:FtsP/CotA-like multicopper oxidase with cupredoxin domain
MEVDMPRLERLPPFILLVTVILSGAAAFASPPGGPCAFVAIDVAKFGRQPFQNPPNERAQHGRLATTLAVQYTNRATTAIGGCPVTLRTYNGQLVGPTLRLRAGDALDLRLVNQLPRKTPDEAAAQLRQEASNAHIDTVPHSFNTTNLHTHGLHVSPVGNSDNVLLAIPPQTAFPYEIKVPANHPAGTFWYHAHTHGSTAIQVGSGMAGALIIEDDETKLPAALREATRREQVFVFQTILYDTQGKVDDITAFFPDSPQTQKLCDEGQSGCTWQHSKRRITVNGQIIPVIKMRPGEVRRWRLIDTSFRESLNLQLEGHALHEIALDGIYLGKIDTWGPGQSVELQPGYRSDVLVKASSQPGTYRLIDAASTTAQSLRGVAEPENVLAEVVIEGEPLEMSLPTNAEMAALNPFPGVNLQATADGVQEAVFKLGSSLQPQDQRNYFQVNYHAFNPSRIRYVRLDATDMWSLTTVGDPPGVPSSIAIPPLPHVFHIHVNPFQTTRKGPQGQDETVWKDTLLIPAGQRINIYTQYLDYVGQFVMHCHILDHEDLGMMEIVEVVGEQPVSSLPTTSALPTHKGH